MKQINLFLATVVLLALTSCGAKKELPVTLLNGDNALKTYQTPDGNVLGVELIGHGSVRFEFNDMNIYVDPYSKQADYSTYPDADLICISHNHGDHYDKTALDNIVKDDTQLVVAPSVAEEYPNITKVTAPASIEAKGIAIEVIDAYNVESLRPDGNPFHPKGDGVGFVFNFGGCKVYVAGDSEAVPEMLALTDLDIAFVPKNVPYTMTDEQFLSAVNTLKPKYLYPYHYFDIDWNMIEQGVAEGIVVMK